MPAQYFPIPQQVNPGVAMGQGLAQFGRGMGEWGEARTERRKEEEEKRRYEEADQLQRTLFVLKMAMEGNVPPEVMPLFYDAVFRKMGKDKTGKDILFPTGKIQEISQAVKTAREAEEKRKQQSALDKLREEGKIERENLVTRLAPTQPADIGMPPGPSLARQEALAKATPGGATKSPEELAADIEAVRALTELRRAEALKAGRPEPEKPQYDPALQGRIAEAETRGRVAGSALTPEERLEAKRKHVMELHAEFVNLNPVINYKGLNKRYNAGTPQEQADYIRKAMDVADAVVGTVEAGVPSTPPESDPRILALQQNARAGDLKAQAYLQEKGISW